MHGCNVPHQNFHRSTFSFSESRTAFSFAVQKKKRFWPQLGKRKNNPPSGRPQPNREGVPFRQRKSRFVKFLCRADKISAPTKVRWLAEKRLSARSTPHPLTSAVPTRPPAAQPFHSHPPRPPHTFDTPKCPPFSPAAVDSRNAP